ncbi:hypothetical protein PAAG_00104 [Paracoccidioides lutzii Pb01]|uniref:Uncharacterized protein n=1 Tax=Paracoccidioides lutzii (strain ATCC MYA-826 / Pb01) TaxID=502779 RepID=C1GNK9_PARBA|nr:hypothetical protein PAAG_00104 [Paracoccidioides lutzii Pb01]EEH35781.2 hypothetical protein PAAG_00104 [Paracoccidioides lutzii Pb01]
MSTPTALISGVEQPGMVLGLSCAGCRPRLYIFDFIPETYRACADDGRLLADRTGLADEIVEEFLEGNREFYTSSILGIYRKLPHNLGFLSDITQRAYYLSNQQVTREEIRGVSKLLGEDEIYQENTRWLQAVKFTMFPFQGGDHAAEVKEVCACLEEAKSYAANPPYEQVIESYIQNSATGRTDAYRDSQELWVKDIKPAVETILGFVEPRRDPYGVRAEFEGLVGGLLIHQIR